MSIQQRERELVLHLNIMNEMNWAVPVGSFAEASTELKTWRDFHDLGCSAFGYNSGLVCEDEKPVAFVSYNGRVWEVEEFEEGHFRPHDYNEIKGEK